MKAAILIVCLFFLHFNLKSQRIFESNQDNGKLIIKGTSTLHDWESIVEEFTVKADIEKEGDSIISISIIVMIATVKSIKSGKGIMDNKTYAALKEEEFPSIIFKGPSEKMEEKSLTVNGDLTIAGVTKQISLVTNFTTHGHEISFIGSIDLLMSDYGITPPVALLGTLKTGDQITLEFEFNFKQISN